MTTFLCSMIVAMFGLQTTTPTGLEPSGFNDILKVVLGIVVVIIVLFWFFASGGGRSRRR
jgi:hypothetical protein